MAGVTVGTEVTLDFYVDQLDRQRNVERPRRVSLGGRVESILHRSESFISARFQPVLEEDFGPYRQFLDSVEGGEEFVFDPYGVGASPVELLNCVMESDKYTESRINHSYLTASFKVRVL